MSCFSVLFGYCGSIWANSISEWIWMSMNLNVFFMLYCVGMHIQGRYSYVYAFLVSCYRFSWMFEDVKSLGNACSVIQQISRRESFSNIQCCCICFTARAFLWVHNVDNYCRTQDMQGDPFGLLLSQRIIFMGGEVGLSRICASHTSSAHHCLPCSEPHCTVLQDCLHIQPTLHYSETLWPGRALV